MADSLAALRSTRRGSVLTGKGAAFILPSPRAGAGAKEVVGAAQEAGAMAREREGIEGIAETGGL
jgi:hypothetical protein